MQSVPEFAPFANSFTAEMIAGEDLLELNDADLRELGIDKLGIRKRLIKKIRMLKSGRSAEDTTQSETDMTSSSMHLASIVAKYKRDRVELEVRESDSFKDLSARLANEFRLKSVRLRFKDEDGDLQLIRNDSDFFQVLQDVPRGESLVLYVTKGVPKANGKGKKGQSSNKTAKAAFTTSSAEFAMLEALADPTIVINDDCMVLCYNASAEKMFGYPKARVLGSNINMLMPDTYARKHDGYVANYLATGVKKVIGKTRMVMGKTNKGNMFAIELSVTEAKSEGGTRFIGTLRAADLEGGAGASTSLPPEVQRQITALESMQEAGVIIDVSGEVLYLNEAACNLTGYSKSELVGQNIDKCMPSPHRENHSFYLQRYVSTKVRRVMGSSRDVVMENKSGDALSVNLSLSEIVIGDDYYFVGLLRRSDGVTKTAGGKGNRRNAAVQMARKMINSVGVPAICINEKGLMQGFNAGAEKLFGYQLIEVLGRNVSMLMGPEHAEKHDDYLKAYLTTGVAKVIDKERILEAKTKAGKMKKIKLTVTELDTPEGEARLFIGMLHNVK
jgi:PAS domain S-box-containing protein